jgi:hypothetical protein
MKEAANRGGLKHGSYEKSGPSRANLNYSGRPALSGKNLRISVQL